MAQPPAGQARQYFLVEGILAKRGQGRQKKFLVKWSGYTIRESTWEPAVGLERVEAAIAAFREGQMERARQKRVLAQQKAAFSTSMAIVQVQRGRPSPG